jgi:hypothetical protein
MHCLLVKTTKVRLSWVGFLTRLVIVSSGYGSLALLPNWGHRVSLSQRSYSGKLRGAAGATIEYVLSIQSPDLLSDFIPLLKQNPKNHHRHIHHCLPYFLSRARMWATRLGYCVHRFGLADRFSNHCIFKLDFSSWHSYSHIGASGVVLSLHLTLLSMLYQYSLLERHPISAAALGPFWSCFFAF